MEFSSKLRERLRQRAEQYRNGEIAENEVREYARRASRIMRRSASHERFKTNWRLRFEASRNHNQRLLTALETPDLLIGAFDAGADQEVLTSFGATLFFNGEISTVSFRLSGTEIPTALFGPVIDLDSKNELREIAIQFLEQVDYAIFHSMHSDLQFLDIPECPVPFYDTIRSAMLWYDDGPSLDVLCNRYGIDNSEWHESGNDSRRTFQVATHMCRDRARARFLFSGDLQLGMRG